LQAPSVESSTAMIKWINMCGQCHIDLTTLKFAHIDKGASSTLNGEQTNCHTINP